MAQAPKITFDPYAPPAEPSHSPALDPEDVDFRPERRSLLVVLALFVVTLGLYPLIWLLRRQAFLARLRVKPGLGMGILIAASLFEAISIAMAFGGSRDAEMLRMSSSALGGLLLLLAMFRVRSMLDVWASQRGYPGARSAAATFFFGVFHLQYAINRIADRQDRADIV